MSISAMIVEDLGGPGRDLRDVTREMLVEHFGKSWGSQDAGLWKLLTGEISSDVSIFCRGYECKAHRVILCDEMPLVHARAYRYDPRTPTPILDFHTQTVELTPQGLHKVTSVDIRNYDPVTVDRYVELLYSYRYHPYDPTAVLLSWPPMVRQPSTAGHRYCHTSKLLHIQLAHIALDYGPVQLNEVARNKLAKAFHHQFEADKFHELVNEVARYRKPQQELVCLLVQEAYVHMNELVMAEEIDLLHPQFIAALLKLVVKNQGKPLPRKRKHLTLPRDMLD
ncbi:uncharacterized protein BDZ99DRAFT_570978 [Mytilinidion resinicola]|uniref:BTB domain-containing protein n=1 Tax=Mytilinidion resinicola TaxID=574789 RepID=A0A6A6YPC2_9PEZI|nr:uncharacterized protein BDZ99DRAFT_570978 [Mytilinidion resinicola]KAF2810399.1 hypothetical protein BDZ99DRAFT_570978 [Mytilinidion resinicola]